MVFTWSKCHWFACSPEALPPGSYAEETVLGGRLYAHVMLLETKRRNVSVRFDTTCHLILFYLSMLIDFARDITIAICLIIIPIKYVHGVLIVFGPNNYCLTKLSFYFRILFENYCLISRLLKLKASDGLTMYCTGPFNTS
jgi:hypothetical protein